METVGTPAHTELEYQLPTDAYYHLVRALRLTLPPPRPDTAENLLKRDRAAMAEIAALAPGNAAEAKFAAQAVAASERWLDCLRLARQPETTPERALKYGAQAATMMRQANSAMRVLLQMQAARRKLEADNVACNRATWAEHVATRLMAEALAAQPATPEPAPEPAEKPAPCEPAPAKAADTGPAPVAEPQPAPALTGAALTRRHMETDPELIAGAERYAAAYPERAAKIRRTGKRPGGDTLYFDPPEASLVPALIGARTPALLALDQAFPAASGASHGEDGAKRPTKQSPAGCAHHLPPLSRRKPGPTAPSHERGKTQLRCGGATDTGLRR